LFLRFALFFGERTGASLPPHTFLRFPLLVALTPRDAFLNIALLLGQPLRTALLLQALSGLPLLFGLALPFRALLRFALLNLLRGLHKSKRGPVRNKAEGAERGKNQRRTEHKSPRSLIPVYLKERSVHVGGGGHTPAKSEPWRVRKQDLSRTSRRATEMISDSISAISRRQQLRLQTLRPLSCGRSRDRFNKRNRLNAQCVRQFDDVDQPNVSLASFDPADVVSMKVRQFG
jgi:hypothetical protein